MPKAKAQDPIQRGTLLLEDHPKEIKQLFKGGKINIDELRDITNFLTNRDILFYKGWRMKKRKKAFMRHVKHISEELEWDWKENKSVTDRHIDLIYELVLFDASLKQAAFADNQRMGTLRQKYGMYKSYKKSPRVFTYKIPATQSEIIDPKESPYWHEVQVDSLRHKQFDFLAKRKKIRAKKRMVILFSSLSYSGSAPKVEALDLDYDNKWSLKWGDEVHTDVLGSRIFASLGYDVDHPYFYPENKLTLIFDGNETIKNANQMADSVQDIFQVDIRPFISQSGKVTKEMGAEHKKLIPYIGCEFVRFKKCAIEGRPDRVKRLGSFLPNEFNNHERKALRGSILAHAWIGNWDTREENTRLTTVHDGNYNYRMSAAFTDLGTSLGVKMTTRPADFKVGLINELPWEVTEFKGKSKIRLNNGINSILKPYSEADYEDLRWMASKIARVNEEMLRHMVKKAGWPKPIRELYFHKMASRRASILNAFNIQDLNPIAFNRNFSYEKDGKWIIKDGILLKDYEREMNPESFLSTKGRTRNYGNE